MDSRRYWGHRNACRCFRFDLALGLWPVKLGTKSNSLAAFLRTSCHQDPVLFHTKLIARTLGTLGEGGLRRWAYFPCCGQKWNANTRELHARIFWRDHDCRGEFALSPHRQLWSLYQANRQGAKHPNAASTSSPANDETVLPPAGILVSALQTKSTTKPNCGRTTGDGEKPGYHPLLETAEKRGRQTIPGHLGLTPESSSEDSPLNPDALPRPVR